MRALLQTYSWQELRHHPWRSGAAVLAIMLGVALALAVHLINRSALAEFAQAVGSINGQPDVQLRSSSGTLPESVFARVAAHPQVQLATPVLQAQSTAIDSRGQRVPLRLVGVDALSVATLAPALMPQARGTNGSRDDGDKNERFDLFAPDTVFLNPSARAALRGQALQLQQSLSLRSVRVAGSVSAGGAPLAVMDIGALQDLLGLQGQLSRIDVRLMPGAALGQVVDALELPDGARAQAPSADTERASMLSRAYRVNLTVLALVALFTGAFLVFSVLSLSVAKRAPQLALLGVLGLTGRERLQLVLAESALLGAVGAALGVALGALLAWAALRFLGGDLGGGYFAGVRPTLQWSSSAALLFGVLGVVAAMVGGWWPARAAQQLAPAQALKNLSANTQARQRGVGLMALGLLLLALLLSFAPPVWGMPLAAYLAVALLLLGGVAALPAAVTELLARLPLRRIANPLALLALERARRIPGSGSVATSGVVAAVALAVALTVMVASFRDSVSRWLDVLLPAELYVRSSTSASNSESATYLPPDFVAAVAKLPGVRRVESLRVHYLPLQADLPAVALLVRDLPGPPSESLPLVGTVYPVPQGAVPLYVSEAFVDLYPARSGQYFELKLVPALTNTAQAAINSIAPDNSAPRYFIAGVWRDYARQHGSVVMARGDYLRLGGDERVNDLALSLQPNTDATQVQTAVRELAARVSGNANAGELMEFASATHIRATSLRIFDRSFAVTYWLQAVAIGIGLFGVAASFSAQVLARRKEFGLLAHLGLTRKQVLRLVALEGLVWTVLGALAGLLLGAGVAFILVHVVNPQSFHWTMDMVMPWARLGALALAVVLAGTLTAWLAGRAAASREAVVAVKEDW